jgi:hypothetical protein
LELKYLKKEKFFWAKIFRAFCSQVDLSVGKSSDQNIVIRFVGIYHHIGQNSSKMSITMERKHKGTYPFGDFHISLGSMHGVWTQKGFISWNCSLVSYYGRWDSFRATVWFTSRRLFCVFCFF